MRVHKLVGRLIEIFLTQKIIGTVKIKFMKENYPESTLVIMFFFAGMVCLLDFTNTLPLATCMLVGHHVINM
jgi:hypothetical protein